MPKYKYEGEGPMRIGGAEVKPGDVVVASWQPGARFVLVEDPTPPKKEKKEMTNG